MSVQPTVCLHIGTHKTGTKALQAFLSDNEQRLAEHGIYYAKAGRIPLSVGFTAGQHLISSDFLSSTQSEAFDEFLSEIEEQRPPLVILSSETFQFLGGRPETLTIMRDAFAERGYATAILVYLRAQSRYVESLYGEYAKTDVIGSFDRYLERALELKRVLPAPNRIDVPVLEYTKLLAPFAEVFGRNALIPKPYHPHLGAEFIFRDFLNAAAHLRGPVAISGLNVLRLTANVSLSFEALLHAIHASAERQSGTDVVPTPRDFLHKHFPEITQAFLARRFSLLTYDDVAAFIERFSEDNLRLRDEYGVTLSYATLSEIPAQQDDSWSRTALQRRVLSAALEAWGIA